jgi:hypothetical protein
MNRPPTPNEVLPFDDEGYADYYAHDDEMQEALTCEWLIQEKLMPDPTDYNYREQLKSSHMLLEWNYEDKSK